LCIARLENGYALRFEPAPGNVEELARFVEFERGCGSFLDLALRVEMAHGPIWLDRTGGADAKAFRAPIVEKWTS